MKTIRFILYFFIFSALNLIFADEVFLKNGTSLQGTVTKVNNNNTIDFILKQNGEVYNIPYADIFKVEYNKLSNSSNKCLGNYKDGDASITLKGNKSFDATILSEQKKQYLVFNKKTKKSEFILKSQILKLQFKEKGLKKPSKNFFLVKNFLNEEVNVILNKGQKIQGKVLKKDCESFTILGKKKKEDKIFYSSVQSIKPKKEIVLNKNTQNTWKRFVPGLYQLQTGNYVSAGIFSSLFFGSVGVAVGSYNKALSYSKLKTQQMNSNQLILSTLNGSNSSSTAATTTSGSTQSQNDLLLINTVQSNQVKAVNAQIVQQVSIMNAAAFISLMTYTFNWIQTGGILKREIEKTKIAQYKGRKKPYYKEDSTKFLFSYDIKATNEKNYYSSVEQYDHTYNIGFSHSF